MRKILSILIICTMLFSGLFLLTGCGEEENSVTGGGNAKKFDGKDYNYNPPKDNYYVETKEIDGDETSITARIGSSFVLVEKDGDNEILSHTNDDQKKLYTKYEGKWYIDSNYSYEDYVNDDEGDYIGTFDAMEGYFMKYFRAYGYENERLSEYYVGSEKIAGVDCWVFDSKGLNGIYMKFWVDPQNSVTLKYVNTENNRGMEATKYNLNYKTWTDGLVPDSYEGIEVL